MRRWLWFGVLLACAGPIGPKGDNGTAGPAGQNALVAVSAESPGTNCSGGGIAVKSGLDSNGSGTLDPAEVANTSYVCNGSVDTPAQVLAKVETVDGVGSGLDADLLQGEPLGQVAPTGTVVAFAGSTIPTGWLLCDGRAISRTGANARLFGIIGVIHGGGDGSTTFNLPDYRGRFLRGVDGSAGRDPDRAGRTAPGVLGNAGNQVGSVQLPATARPTSSFTTDVQGAHTHSNGNFNRLLQVTGQNTVNATDNVGAEPDLINSAAEATAGAHAHSITGGGDSETRPQNAYVQYIIKM
ncbi:MAG TPA: phage tail protein [Myxococcales bacterium]|nr:phage tail protein [Myxococcales bacterium]